MTYPDGYEGPLAEFVALREEMSNRIQRQQGFQTLQLTAAAAIFSFALSQPRFIGILLAVPAISYLFCGRFVAQHHGIARIGAYIDGELSHRVPGGLNWGQWLRTHGWYKARTTSLTLPLLLTFPGVSLASEGMVFSYVFTRQHLSVLDQTFLIGFWSVGIIATGLCIYLILGVVKSFKI